MKSILLTFLMGCPVLSSAQLDSLLSVLRMTPSDTVQLPILTELLRATVFSDPDSGLYFAERYRGIAKKRGTELQQGMGHNFTGMCHSGLGEHDRALEHYLKALEHFEHGGDPWYVAMAHNNIGSVHEKQKRWDRSKAEFALALDGFNAINDTVWVANVSNNLGNIHYELREYDRAAERYSAAERILVLAGMEVYAGNARMNLANVLEKQGSKSEAMRVMRSALAVMPVGEDDHSRAGVLSNLGRLHSEIGDQDSALYFLHQAMDLASKSQAMAVVSNVHAYLGVLFERMGRLDSALYHHKRWSALNDSMFNSERSAQITEMQEKYDSGRKDMLLAESKAQLEQRSLTIKAVAVGAALLLLAAVFAFRAYRIKKRTSEELAQKNAVIDEQLKEKELLLREIHHRVKNNLQTVSSLLSIQGRGIADPTAKQAVNDSRLRVKSMALIHQDLYRDGDLTGVQMKDYVEKLATSLISSYDRADGVQLHVAIEDISLDVDTAVPLGLILNELITNALKYAWPDAREGTLAIEMAVSGDALRIAVRDNGIGYDPNRDRSAESTGFGLGMIKTFASKLKAEWSIRNENGTVVDMIVRNFKLAR
jgi:two-component system, sensor histidine kinase PdtaS